MTDFLTAVTEACAAELSDLGDFISPEELILPLRYNIRKRLSERYPGVTVTVSHFQFNLTVVVDEASGVSEAARVVAAMTGDEAYIESFELIKHEELSKLVLCYIDHDDGEAYFTDLALSEQWGDDWDDAPYEHNAGVPYAAAIEVAHDIKVVSFNLPNFQTPAQIAGNNSGYSVKDINAGETPWLQNEEGTVTIMAGTEINQFIKTVQSHGGGVVIK